VAFEIDRRKFGVARDFIVQRRFYPVGGGREGKRRAPVAKTLAEWLPLSLR